MMRSMFMGVSGLRNHQLKMDVIGNNIANVNTLGFKSSRVTFQELFNQTIRSAVSPQAGKAGINPMQVGSGVSVSTIDTTHLQGNSQPTENPTDMAIDGNGFFVVGTTLPTAFTRAGNFTRDAYGSLTSPSGLKVFGWVADDSGVFPLKDQANLRPIQIPIGQAINPVATTAISFAQNLGDNTTSYQVPVDVSDSKGNKHTIDFNFVHDPVTPNEWDWSGSYDGVAVGGGTITFDTDTSYAGVVGNSVSLNLAAAGADNMTIELDFSHLTQNASETTIVPNIINGYPAGTLKSFTISPNGSIIGIYSNGLSRAIAQVAVAAFNNPGGLIKQGENMYTESINSGLKQIGEAGSGGRGTIIPSSLEMSNVDLAQEFTDMIVTQRGFQANSRILNTSDEMLQELVNLKR